ncbi:MAG: hypothetical protein [Wendovervirus sonii]|uniref:Uncharacterized protein n=1 Tax=phage Lak_Megaphage_Sonny TaxID=3109229 RepID=A0ABZ0Z4F8_9CAUD|nr:MAG: hypothetical protein [phage Lak_Megaphage_Sonny]
MKLLENINELKYKTDFYIFNNTYNYNSYTYLCVHPHNDKFILALNTSDYSLKNFLITDINDHIQHKNVLIGDYDEIAINEFKISLLKDEIKRYEDRNNYIKESRQQMLNINDLKINNSFELA